MAVALAAKPATDTIFGPRRRARYNGAERQFSLVLQRRVEELLRGRRSSLLLVRRYPDNPDRLGVMATPPGLPRAELRIEVVEALARQTIDFFRLKAAGGPVSQAALDDGGVVERQLFPTKFPHIVLVRTDHFSGGDGEPADVTWSLERLQNQRAQTEVNRLIDAASLLIGLVRLAG